MKFARGLLIFSYGLFSIAAQTLLFREFVTTFEGNDISVGIFFGSWFLWVGLGAILVRRAKTFAEKLVERIEFLFLAYVPAFILQAILILQARELAGIESYALWSVRDILLVSIIVNAPISIVTGMLFPTACRWVGSNAVRQDKRLPVSHVYTLEAAGSFVGGIGVTVLLSLGVSLARAFFILAFVLSSSVFVVQLVKSLAQDRPSGRGLGSRKITCAFSFLVPLFVCLCLMLGADKTLMRYVRAAKWTKLLPKDALAGSFQTAQAEYLYGTYQDQWIAVREGGVTEALPDESAAGRIAAIGLCQKPDAKKALIIGSGLGLCREFLRLPQIEEVTWAHCDSEYVQKVNEFIPSELKITDRRLRPLAGDVRSLLARKQESFDMVIVNLPDATSSVLNRYYTLEFYRQIEESLGSDGVLAVRIAGGENIMGTELVNLGASTKLTLEKVFSRLVLTPGEHTWFIASDSENITGDPGTLRDRFAAIDGASRIFTPEALLSVYLPDRAALALKSYSRADLPEEFLVNRDSRPLTHLYSLLLASRQSGAPAARLVKHLMLAGPLPFLVPILVFVALRSIYIRKSTQQGKLSGFDSSFLVFSAGAIGIGAVIVLMYLYQTRFGSLYLHIGVVSSLFMAGLTAGAASVRYLLAEKRKARTEMLLFPVIFAHSLILCTIAFWPAQQWSHLTFAVAFVLCGLCAGSYFPIAARQLADSDFETGRAGSKLETADHIGASVGGVVTSLALVPVLGAGMTLLVFVMLILANTPPPALRIFKPERVWSSDATPLRLRSLGYLLFGVGVSVVLCSNLLAGAGARLRPSLPQHSVQALAGELRTEQESTLLADATKKLDYFRLYNANDNLTGYIFSSEDLASEVRGFGGKMNLAIHVDDPNGQLIRFHIIRSNETPAYLELLSQWSDSLIGRQLFRPGPFADVHAVSGATVSSEAIVSALRTSGRTFTTQILGRPIEQVVAQEPHRAKYLPDISGMYLISAFILALIVTYRGGFWSRLVVLLLNLGLGGIWLNAQYSSEQIVTALSWHAPAIALTGAFLFVAGIPILVLIFGNIYCGYICPFGAAQELLGYVLPERLKQPISTESMRRARFVKYVILLVVIVVFFASRNRTTLAADPLISVFNLQFAIHDLQSTMLLVVAAALIGSVFCTRFWCRFLCPAGAFLSLLNNLTVLKRYLPAKKFGRCQFGLTGKDKMDCICCDKCRYEEYRSTGTQEQKTAWIFLTCVLVVAIFVSTVSVGRFLQVIPTGLDIGAVSASGGEPRDVDLQRVRTMIRQKRLSDKEADFYRKIE
ncbi:MAG: 4Fe-4S binding protein [Planctomycetota bacterium]|jgi:spermidine synthase